MISKYVKLDALCPHQSTVVILVGVAFRGQ